MRVTDLDERTIVDAIEVLTGAPWREDRERAIRDYAAGRITWDLHARRVYSYGSHFALFEYVPRAGREPATFVINGDEWRGNNSRTRSHQESARAAIERTGIRSIIVPFSALDGAGIAPATVRPIHVRDDARWTETHALPDGAPDLDALETADRMDERDERSETDWRGEPCASHGTWSREYVWHRGGRRYSRRLYRQAHAYTDGRSAWRASNDWSAPVAEHVYLDGSHELTRDAAGVWSYVTHHHRLGDSLFSAVRVSREPARPAEPFEHEHETARETVSLRDADGRTYCTARADGSPDSLRTDGTRDDSHEAGPSGACVYCDSALRADVTRRRRARYLSSFDSNENPPLYFLAEVPRGAGSTVEHALDALAPRAVHAAIARGRHVLRQGDIFLVGTELTREDLAERGATFARLTQWTRDARARRGEVGYRPPQTADERRRELTYARRVWHERFRAAVADATSGETAGARPQTGAGSRARWRKLREQHAAAVADARDVLRRATIGRPRRVYPHYGESLADATRREHVAAIERARDRLEALLARGARDSNENTSRAHGRDAYRGRYGTNARGAWTAARHLARERFRPGETDGTDAARARRERVRRALAIYGTAHSASETATVRGAVYARGTVRQVPDLEPGRRGGRDHRPVTLGDGTGWYLAIRNRVPRQQTSRRNRRRATAGTVPAEG